VASKAPAILQDAVITRLLHLARPW